MDHEIFTRIRENPCALDELSARQFEELVAELLAFFGWEVSLTTRSRDGGYDILGITRDPTGLETSWIVECKHFRRDRKVGVHVARSLYGIAQDLGVHQALLATSSFVTRDTQLFTSRTNRVQIVDRDRLLSWVTRYTPGEKGQAHLPAQRFSSCFVSYSNKDRDFVERFVSRLRATGIRVWFAPEDLVGGTKLYEEISDAIERFDRLLIVLSSHSMNSQWVKTEIKNAKRRETRDGKRVLFPISLVPFEAIRQWELFDSDLGQDLARELREYFMPDFSAWTDPAKFENQFAKVVAGLHHA